jgi:hypothetical protein
MLNDISETRIPITLDKEYVLYFNANTMCAFEEATGKNFLATVAALYDAYKPFLETRKNGAGQPAALASLDVIRHVPMSELTALIWAGLHTYDDKDEPHWPLTLSQVRRLINVSTIPRLFLSFLRGQTANSPTTAEMGESQALSETPEKPTSATAPPQAVNGGERSIELPEDAFT